MCLIVQAIRAKQSGMGMMNGATLPANLSKFVLLGRRPTSGKRRKRDSTGKKNNAGHLKSKTLEGSTRRESTDGNVSDALVIQYGDKHDIEPRETDEMELAGLDARTITAIRDKFDSNDTRQFSEGTENSRFNQTEEEVQSDNETVETSEDLDNAEEVHQAHVYREDVAHLGLWPMANVDDMYRALLMIAEGYSQYHQKFYTG
jgi:hypothetical protein